MIGDGVIAELYGGRMIPINIYPLRGWSNTNVSGYMRHPVSISCFVVLVFWVGCGMS